MAKRLSDIGKLQSSPSEQFSHEAEPLQVLPFFMF